MLITVFDSIEGPDGFSNQNNSFGPGPRQNNFDQNFSRRDSKGDGFYGDNRGQQSNRGNFGRDDFNQQRGGNLSLTEYFSVLCAEVYTVSKGFQWSNFLGM